MDRIYIRVFYLVDGGFMRYLKVTNDKVSGQPFKISEIEQAIRDRLGS